MTSARDLFSDSLTQVDTEDMNNLLSYLKKINVNKCTNGNNILKIFSIDGQDQFNNACVISSYLKTDNLKMSEENILIGNKQLQQVFYPMDILSDSKKSANGIVALSGLKGSEKFIIVKYPLFDNPYPVLKELAVGLKMNELRLKIPNIMYTYGGLYCSSPVNMDYVYSKVEKKLEEKFVYMMIKLFISLGLINIENESELEEYKALFRNVGEELSQKIMLNVNVLDKRFIKMIFDNIRMIVTEGYDLIDEIQDEDFKKERLNKLKSYEVILKNIRDNKDVQFNLIEVKNTLYKIYNDQIKDNIKDFDYSLFCNSNVLSTLLLAEFIPNSVDLETAWYNMTEKEQIDTFCQLIFTLNMAWQHCKFTHNDLHERNIMVRKSDAINIKYEVVVNKEGGKEIINIRTSSIPIMIDFGEASINDNGYQIENMKSNFNEVLGLIEIVLNLNEDKDNKINQLTNIKEKYINFLEDNINFNPEIYRDIIDWYRT